MVNTIGTEEMFGKSKSIKNKIEGKEEKKIKEEAPKRRGRKPKEEVKQEEKVEEVEQEPENEQELTDNEILHDIDQDIGKAKYMLSRRDVQEAIDNEGIRILSDILLLADIALISEDVQKRFVEEYKVVEAQRIEYQRRLLELEAQKQAEEAKA